MPNINDKLHDKKFHNWNGFEKWAEKNGVELKYVEDYDIYWDCWCMAYNSAMNED